MKVYIQGQEEEHKYDKPDYEFCGKNIQKASNIQDNSKPYSFLTLWEVLQFSVRWMYLCIEKLNQLYGDNVLFFMKRMKQNLL